MRLRAFWSSVGVPRRAIVPRDVYVRMAARWEREVGGKPAICLLVCLPDCPNAQFFIINEGRYAVERD